MPFQTGSNRPKTAKLPVPEASTFLLHLVEISSPVMGKTKLFLEFIYELGYSLVSSEARCRNTGNKKLNSPGYWLANLYLK